MFVSVTIVLCFTVSPFAQGNEPRPDGWRGLVLDVSGPDNAIRLFGTPAKDKDKTALDMQRPLSWLSDKFNQKVFRTLTYKKLSGYKQVQFSFLNNKLVLISLEAPDAELEENWIDPDDLEGLFRSRFQTSQPEVQKQTTFAIGDSS